MIELRLLGSVELRTTGGTEVLPVLVQPKRMALLSYLAVEGARGFHRRDSLIGMFWPNLDQSRARGALRQALHFLRQTVGAEVVARRGTEEVGLDFSKVRSDVASFREAIRRNACEEAVGLYGGTLLEGLTVGDAPEFERWLETERARLARAHAGALEALAAAAAEAGDGRRAVEWWRRLVVEDPFSSSVALRLMEALDAVGDSIGALEHAKRYAHVLREELGVDPDPEVDALAAQIRGRRIRPSVPPAGRSKMPVRDQSAAAERRPRRVALSGAVVAAAVALAAAAGVLARSGAGGEPPGAELGPTIAIHPFDAVGPATEPYLAAGMSDAVLWKLAGVSGLLVFDAAAVDQDGATAAAVQEADYVLDASVERIPGSPATDTVHVAAALTRVADGARVWAATFHDGLRSMFQLQGRISDGVVRAAGIHPPRSEREWLYDEPTRRIDAYDLFLRGNEYLDRIRDSEENLGRALQFFDRAVALDPAFVHAHAHRSQAHLWMYLLGHDATDARLALAKAAADEAIRLRPDLPMAHLALGWYYHLGTHEYDRALRHFELARASWPALYDVTLVVAGLLQRQGDFEEAAAAFEQGTRVPGACRSCAADVAMIRILQRDEARAGRAVQRARAADPDNSYTKLVAALWHIASDEDTAAARALLTPAEDFAGLAFSGTGWFAALPRILGGAFDSLLQVASVERVRDTSRFYLTKAERAARAGDQEAARRHYRAAADLLVVACASPMSGPVDHSRLAVAFAGLGMREEALQAAAEAAARRPLSADAVEGALILGNQARVLVMLGEYDAAIDILQTLLRVPSAISPALLRLDPVWAPLRAHPRFADLLMSGEGRGMVDVATD